MKIKDLGTVITGKTPSTKQKEYWNGKIHFVTPADLQRGKHIFKTDRYITDAGKNAVKGSILPSNSICVSCIGNIGYVSITTQECVSNQQINAIIPNQNNDPDFIYYLMKNLWPYFKNYEGQSTTVSILNKSQFSDIDVPEIDINTQKRIASVLSSIDSKIELNNKINDNLLQQAQAIYDEICNDCEPIKLESLISVIETGLRPKGGAESEGIPSIGAEKIERFGTYDFSGEKYISEEFFSKLKRGIVLSGDVLLYKDGAYTGKSSMALDGFPHEKCAVNEHVFILRTRDNFAQYFLYFTLSSPSIREKIYTLACSKAAQPGLNQQELFSVEAPIPPDDVLQDFDKQVDPLMHAIALNALENLKLSNLRDSLLPKLMSGEIDVDSIKL